MSEILAIDPTITSNAQLVARCASLGYIGDYVLDPTYGLGRFWAEFKPQRLVGHDILPDKAPDGVMDFTKLLYEDGTFDTVVFDPPYKLNGTGGSHASDESYGVDWAYLSWQEKHDLIGVGLSEAIRVTRRGGHVLLKCQDQVCSGAVRWQTRIFADRGEAEGATLVDRLDILGYRKQPPGRRQLHARRNHSTMLVFQT